MERAPADRALNMVRIEKERVLHDADAAPQRGASVSYGSVQLGRDRQAARRHLRDHPELAARLERDLRARLIPTPTPMIVEAAAS